MTQEIDIEKYHQLALQKQKEHRKVLTNLKKKPPKNLDIIAQEIHDEVFQENRLYACANCCKTLGPDFKEADITRIAKYFKMKLPAFEAEFLQVDEDGDKVFKSMPCPFLGLIISVISMMSVLRPVQLFLTRIVRKSIRSII